VSYANQSGIGRGPINGGLFLGSDASTGLTDTGKFGVSPDQRNTLHTRVRLDASHGLWFAAGAQYGSGLPADLSDNTDTATLIAQYGAVVVSRVNFTKQRVEPNFSMDLGMGVQLYRKEARSLQIQIQATNIADRFNVINFASVFSGTALAPPRSVSARLRVSF
jgi:hypothetical protein